MILYFEPGVTGIHSAPERSVRALVPVTTEAPPTSDAPSAWMCLRDVSELHLCDLDTPPGRDILAEIIDKTSLYRLSLELRIDKVLLAAKDDPVRSKAVASAFAPEDVPETIYDKVAQQYQFEGTLKHPAIASLSALQLVELYLRLYGPAMPNKESVAQHLAHMVEPYPSSLLSRVDGIMWRGRGIIRMDALIYGCERADYDPAITYESYVARGRQAAEKLHGKDAVTLFAAWLSAEDVQAHLCRSIDNVLSLPDLKRLPRWVRADVFRILEREAMKQVFAERLMEHINEMPALKRQTELYEPIKWNAQGDVSPLIQQLLNQTLAVDGNYSGGAAAFADKAEKRRKLAAKLI